MVLGCDKGGSSFCTFLIVKKIHDSYIGPSQGPPKLASFFLTCLFFLKKKALQRYAPLKQLDLLTWCITVSYWVSLFSGAVFLLQALRAHGERLHPNLPWLGTSMMEATHRGRLVLHLLDVCRWSTSTSPTDLFPATRMSWHWFGFVENDLHMICPSIWFWF